ncbi:hypothetical protein [Paludibacterium paludis]|nr:hypothetical protein [Paludibacterium paludis]
MKSTTLIAASLFAVSAFAAHAGDGFLNVQRLQDRQAKAEQAAPSQSEADRLTADDYAGKVIKANPENYRVK